MSPISGVCPLVPSHKEPALGRSQPALAPEHSELVAALPVRPWSRHLTFTLEFGSYRVIRLSPQCGRILFRALLKVSVTSSVKLVGSTF